MTTGGVSRSGLSSDMLRLSTLALLVFSMMLLKLTLAMYLAP